MGNTFAVRIGGPKGVLVKTYSKEFKLEAVRRMKTCKTISGLAAELGVARRFLYKWREQLRTEGEEALARRPGQPRSKEQLAASAKKARAVAKKKVQGPLQKRIAELERRLGAKQLEVDFFRRTFEHVRGVMQNPENAGGKPSIKESKHHSHSKEKD
jgi:transposase